MDNFRASSYPYIILRHTKNNDEVYPYLRSSNGDKNMWCVSPHHGRSYIVGRKNNGRYIISKGNGLSYTQYNFLHTGEFGDDTFGLLLKKDAIRDFSVGIEVEKLGIKTNKMEYVLQLEHPITLTNGHTLKPILLQYSVECPYRICDASFYEYSQDIKAEVAKWDKYNVHGFDKAYLIAADVLLGNLKTLHTNPYDKEDENRHVQDYFNREVVYTYEVINFIAHYLGEKIDDNELGQLFEEHGLNYSIHSITD